MVRIIINSIIMIIIIIIISIILNLLFSSDSLWQCRFCSNPFESTFICEVLNKIEDELYDILEMNPNVKDLEGFIKKNSKDLHSKHFLNLIGMGQDLTRKHLNSFFFTAQRNIINILTRESNITRDMAKKVIKLGKSFKVCSPV